MGDAAVLVWGDATADSLVAGPNGSCGARRPTLCATMMSPPGRFLADESGPRIFGPTDGSTEIAMVELQRSRPIIATPRAYDFRKSWVPEGVERWRTRVSSCLPSMRACACWT